ncbi:hypothetical protein M409DRAFT_17629 [Zasmidium cellare ATCC 36951]|uniref:Ribosomal RNA-processing protein 43 n=1 Tax=Zasmidium cellare ATCC 36951 TaxID=1080233 RepID=A0A6A6CZD1_ZASCE|nr:uncharacterized protein M409DRAFT_17629 [Zasmidium cellare ATCC 36951]KAF2172395.1 hypothetical protein M409DRAFT_17629 [Zasmidium cellare ATCC 36951]
MANGAETGPGLILPQDTFAKLTPRPYLLAHLKHKTPVRPNGRQQNEFRQPTINTGSLTHSNGSAVVRVGDTAVVCGVRGEILLASDIPHPPSDDLDDQDLVEELGLVVANLELSTGCSPAHIPGNPPTSLAQSLSYRISSLLNDSHCINAADLCITYTQPKTEDDLPDEPPKEVTKAYWTLYIDILCLALDGNAFDAAWLAVTAALRDTTLPKAWWDPDRESILCSPVVDDSTSLRLSALPLASTFAVFTTASPLEKREEAQSWILADPDGFEEDICDETLTVVLSSVPSSDSGAETILKIEKTGGAFIGRDVTDLCVRQAAKRTSDLNTALDNR